MKTNDNYDRVVRTIIQEALGERAALLGRNAVRFAAHTAREIASPLTGEDMGTVGFEPEIMYDLKQSDFMKTFKYKGKEFLVYRDTERVYNDPPSSVIVSVPWNSNLRDGGTKDGNPSAIKIDGEIYRAGGPDVEDLYRRRNKTGRMLERYVHVPSKYAGRFSDKFTSGVNAI